MVLYIAYFRLLKQDLLLSCPWSRPLCKGWKEFLTCLWIGPWQERRSKSMSFPWSNPCRRDFYSSYLFLVKAAIESNIANGVCLGSWIQLVFSHSPHNMLPKHDVKHFGGSSILMLSLDAILNSHLQEGRHVLGLIPHNSQLDPINSNLGLLQTSI